MIGIIQLAKKRKRLVFLLLSLALSACETEEEAAQSHLLKGKELLEKGDYAAAQLELKSANKGVSTAESYYYLALLDEKAKHYLAMQDNLQKTLELDPDHYEARIRLGKLELLMGAFDEANKQVDLLIAKNPDDIKALALKASVLVRGKQEAEANVLIARVLELDPNNIEGLSLQAVVLMQNEQLDEAIVIVNKAIALDASVASLHGLRINIHGKQKNTAAVIQDYLTLIDSFPDKNAQYKISLAKIYTREKKNTEAEAMLHSLISDHPKAVHSKILLLDFLMTTDEEKVNPQIDAFRQQFAQQEPNQLLVIAKWALAQGETAKVDEILLQIISEESGSKIAKKAQILQAKIAFDQQDYAKSNKITTELLQRDANQLGAKLLQARVLLVEEKYAEAKTYLDKMLWSHPKSDETLALFAQYYVVMGDEPAAQLKFKAALEINPANIEAFIPVYDSVIKKGGLKYARDILKKALRLKPQEAVFVKRLVALNIQEEKWDEATKSAIQLAKLPKNSSLATYYLAGIFQKKGECEKAISIYKQLIRNFPEQLSVLQGMSECYESLDKVAEMTTFLKQHKQKYSGNVAATVVLSDLYVKGKQYKTAIKLLNSLLETQPESIVLRQKLAKIYTALGQNKKATSTYQQGLQFVPGNIRLSLALAAIYEKQALYTEAIKVYEVLHIENPDLQVVNNNLAVLLVEQFSTEDNIQRAFQLVDSFGDSQQPYYRDTYAWVLLSMGKVAESIGFFKQLIVEAANTPVFRYHLAVAEYQDGNISTAMVELDQAIELGKLGNDFPEQKKAEKLMADIKKGR
ncbi:MAG: tetratricopeptide repeat protein [Methyloprofundus sp.]|nr:tetratricopeptide repeat protein [Methyloprofundus sp.]